MPDLSRYARQLREMADALEAESDATDDHLAPDSLDIINGRHTTRGQINYAVPDALQLQRRIRRFHADHSLQHGDIVALALDASLDGERFNIVAGAGITGVGIRHRTRHRSRSSVHEAGRYSSRSISARPFADAYARNVPPWEFSVLPAVPVYCRW